VAFDARHGVWLISSLGIRSNGTNQVVTSRSTIGGLSWSNPVATSTTGNPDKNWIACDNTASRLISPAHRRSVLAAHGREPDWRHLQPAAGVGGGAGTRPYGPVRIGGRGDGW